MAKTVRRASRKCKGKLLTRCRKSKSCKVVRAKKSGYRVCRPRSIRGSKSKTHKGTNYRYSQKKGSYSKTSRKHRNFMGKRR